MSAQTMLQIAGAALPLGTPKNAALIVIDAQEEYRDGALSLSGLAPALDNVARLIAHWRENGGTVIHFVHHGESAQTRPWDETQTLRLKRECREGRHQSRAC